MGTNRTYGELHTFRSIVSQGGAGISAQPAPLVARHEGTRWASALAPCVLAGLIAVLAPGQASATAFTVINNLDAGAGSLRQAILDSNAASPGPNAISFNIPGAGSHTIELLSALPAITVPVVIDGYSQPGASANTGAFGTADNAVIEIILDGSLAPALTDGLTLQDHTGSQVAGLNIRDFSGNGLVISGTGGGHWIKGCFIGTDEIGGAAAPNSANGVLVENGNNIVGSLGSDGDRNVISGNGPSNVFAGVQISGTSANSNEVYGNYIGTDATGTVAIGNSVSFGYGVLVVTGASNNAVNGNVISGNGAGLSIQGGLSTCGGNTAQRNLIGTNAAGTAALGNHYNGIGGVAYANATTFLGNVVSGNGSYGFVIGGSNGGSVVIQSNYIGTDRTGAVAIPNTGDGILYEDSGAGNTVTIGSAGVGDGNVIAYNTGNGVNLKVGFGTPAGDAILGNSIHDNGKLGIDLNDDGVTPNGSGPTGPNHLQNYPVLSAATTGVGFTQIVGTLSAAASTTYRVEFFGNAACDASGYGEGQTFLGFANVTTDGSGNAAINAVVSTAVTLGQSVTSTATDPANDTSEFSACVAATAATTLPSTTTITSSLNPTTFGQSVTFTAAVTGAGPTPTGTVSFYDVATLLGSGALDGSGHATFTTTSLSVGSHQITAHYGGDASYAASVSSAVNQVVNAPAPGEGIPALGGAGFLLMACLLAAAGMMAMRSSLAS